MYWSWRISPYQSEVGGSPWLQSIYWRDIFLSVSVIQLSPGYRKYLMIRDVIQILETFPVTVWSVWISSREERSWAQFLVSCSLDSRNAEIRGGYSKLCLTPSSSDFIVPHTEQASDRRLAGASLGHKQNISCRLFFMKNMSVRARTIFSQCL